MQSNYMSFLVCFHPDHSDFYVNGLTLGIVKSESVELAKLNPLEFHASKFKNLAELRASLNESLDKLEIELNKQGNKENI